MNDWIEFKLTDENEMRALATLTAQWVKEGVVFKMEKDAHGVQVQLTGGF